MISIKYSDSLKCRLNSIVKCELQGDPNVLFVVPETAKASVERIIFNTLFESGKKDINVGKDTVTMGVLKQDVLSFMKFAQRIISNSGNDTITGFDDVMLRNVIYHIFVKHGSEFKNFNRFLNRFEYIDRLISLLGDFTRYGITPDDLDEVLGNAASVDEVFYDKIHDLKILISYIHEINEEYGFSLLSSDINRASDFIDAALSDDSFSRRRIYSYLRELKDMRIVIYGFGSSRSFTPQELRFIKALDKLGYDIRIYTLYSEQDPDADTYYFGKTVLDAFRKEGIEFSMSSFEPDEAVVDNDLYKIGMSFALDTKVKIDKPDGSVELLRMDDIDNELSFLCNEIIRLTREEGYRYRDIRVFCPDDEITERFKGIMRLFDLDAFIDKRIVLDNTPVMRFVEVFLQLPMYDYPIDMVLRLLRTGILPVRYELIDHFENYCIRENITNGTRLFDKKRYIPAPEEGRPLYSMYYLGEERTHGGEYLWASVVENVLLPLKDACDKVYRDELLSTKAADLMSYLDKLKRSIEYLRDEFIDRKDTNSASILVRSYKEVMILLTSFKTKLNEVSVTPELFSFLLRVDMRNKVIATIPLTVDSIEIVDFDSACFTPCKVLFMVGCDSSNFPYSGASEGIMSNNELIRLNSEMTIDLPDKIQTKNKEDIIRSSLVINAASDRLIFLLEPEKDFDSEFKDHIIASYEKSIEKKVLFETPVYGLSVEKRHDINDSKISEENMLQLLSNGYKGSVSNFESFNYCALRYMLEGVLKIKQRENGSRVLLSEFGKINHAMLENYMRDISSSCKCAEDLKKYREKLDDKEYLKKLSYEYFEKALSESKMPDKNTVLYSLDLGSKARRAFMHAVPVLVDNCIESDYLPVYFEKRLLDFDKVLKYKTKNGVDFVFTGYIDRADRKTDVNGSSMRIIDYKTGEKEVELEDLANGLQFQLFAYALAVREQGETVDNVGYIETGLKPSSKTSKNEGTNHEYKASEFNIEEMNRVLDLIKQLINKTSEEISQGKADALIDKNGWTNSRHNGCTYCPYKGVCGNNQEAIKSRKKIEIEFEQKPSKSEKCIAILEERSKF
ncbi:MAG: PD-(D/E)XK nuclease family protein [Clostridiales bacterium]|nr:PD-(D/E)XK nuclease family protein [Clostridiales bacterium]